MSDIEKFVLELQKEVKVLKRHVKELQNEVAELKDATNLDPFISKSFKIRASQSFLNVKSHRFELKIVRSIAEKKCTLQKTSKLFRLVVTTRYTCDELSSIYAINPPDDLKLLIELTITIWNEENTKTSRKITCAVYPDEYDALKELFQRMCNDAR